MDSNKISGFNVVIIDGLAIKQNRMRRVIKCAKKVMKNKATLILINGQNKNPILIEQLKDIFVRVKPI